MVRDDFGVPHIYGNSRDNVIFGAGYVGAEDRLFFMDVLRHAGRARLSSFAGPSNKAMDAEQWDLAPYTEQDLQRQIDLAEEVYGAEGRACARISPPMWRASTATSPRRGRTRARCRPSTPGS